jgi:cytoskeletal protein CcmA (bactofilin family)
MIKPLLFLGFGAAGLFFTGCATVAEDYRIPDGVSKSRSYTSVAGDITVGRQATIRDVRTVAGDIDIREGSRVGSLSTVAGDISLAADVKVAGSIKTVAGDVEIARGCTITGNVGTVAGHITLVHSSVTGDVTVTSGRVDLTGTRINGVLRVEAPDDDDDDDRAEIDIGPDSEVTEVMVEPKARARLRIHRTAQVGSVKGIEAEYYR